MMEFEITIRVASVTPIASDELEEIAERCLETLHKRAPFDAFGPVVSADLAGSAIEVDCSVAADTPEQLHEKVGHLGQLLLDSVESFEYQSSTTARRREPALA